MDNFTEPGRTTNVKNPEMQNNSHKVEEYSGYWVASALKFFGVILIIAGVVLISEYGLLFILYGCFSGLFCFGFAEIVDAAHKYLNNK